MSVLLQRTAVDTEDRAAWLSWRRRGIGASESPAIMGLSPFSTPLDIYALKVGESDGPADNLAMTLGRDLEPTVRRLYEAETGHEIVREQVAIAWAGRPYMLATLDGTRDDGRIVEFKTTSVSSHLGEAGTDELPDHWLIQAHHQMIVADTDAVDFAVLSLGRGHRFDVYSVRRDESLCTAILEAAEAFWDRVVSRNPPPFSAPSDLRYLSLLGREGESVGLSMDDLATWATYQEMGREISDKQKVRDTLKAHFHAALGTASVGLLPDGSRIVRKLVARKSYTVAESSHYTLTHKTGDK